MRRGNKPQIVYSEDGKQVLGVNLSSDFTAEHEWGIKEIKEAFGIKSEIDIYGMDKRKIRQIPSDYNKVIWVESGKEGGFVFAHNYFIERVEKNPKVLFEHDELRKHNLSSRIVDEKFFLRAAWDEKSFAVVSDNPTQIAALKEIYTQFSSLNIVIMLGARALFDNGGLMIAIADRMPKSTVEAWEKADKEHHQIRKEFEETGIEKLLKEKGKRYFALRPERDKKDGGLIFWLNPMEQNQNNFGWFKLEDLKEWAEGKGKIPKLLTTK